MTEKQTIIDYLNAAIENTFRPSNVKLFPVLLDPDDWEQVTLQSPPGEIEVVWRHKRMGKSSLELRLTGKWPSTKEGATNG